MTQEPPHAREPHQSEAPIDEQGDARANAEPSPAPKTAPGDVARDVAGLEQRAGAQGDDPLTGDRPRTHQRNEADGPMLDDEGADTVVNHGEHPQVLQQERERASLEPGPAHHAHAEAGEGVGGEAERQR